jgi:Holliday junction DNA helicase RuvA
MIEYIRGELTEITPALAVVEAAGVGYALNISLNTYAAIQNKKDVKLLVHESLSTGGRGMILSAMTPAELCNVISTGNDKMLKGVKGIGLKTAQRIIIDLKDKIVSTGIVDELPASQGSTPMVNNEVKDEAVSALTMLGFAPAPSARTVVEILKGNPDLAVEQVVKIALKQIK